MRDKFAAGDYLDQLLAPYQPIRAGDLDDGVSAPPRGDHAMPKGGWAKVKKYNVFATIEAILDAKR